MWRSTTWALRSGCCVPGSGGAPRRWSLLSGRLLLQNDLHLQCRLAELQRVVALEGDALARRDGLAVDPGDFAASVGDAQAVLVEPDQGEAIDLHFDAGVFLFRQVHVHRLRSLAAQVGDALLEAVILAGAQSL